MNIRQLNEELLKFIENNDEAENVISDIFEDTSGWVFPFCDLQSLRMYDDSYTLNTLTNDELINILSDMGFSIFTITPEYKQTIEELGLSYKTYNNMTFVSDTLDEDELKDQVINEIRNGEV